MPVRRSILLVIAFTACGRNPLGIPASDGASHGQPPASDADAGLAQAPDTARDGALVRADGPGTQVKADACVPLACQDPTCTPAYCGHIWDGCGTDLYCGLCPAGWSCNHGQCFQDDCVPITCNTAAPFPYCGTIGNGCGGTLQCTCPDPAWTCIGHICNGVAAGCVPLAGCVTERGDEFCGGLIGDGCGAVLDCRRECARAGYVCQHNRCVAQSDASPPAIVLLPLPAPPPPPPPPCPPPPPPPPLLSE
jgi:hypothetical protein